eukprot:CAMPEP_0170500868 /NCGR_PEP_ID=MMETSP0208-20121228/36376_1 /TAXON_ID=197538 /ORGANISM="Strombidium inclinatum, Strain S3" /LENGTH=88 /DNA_ID=CAMNT_0010779111 /DNA_START=279 /DNA_END=541 /DNA_ORIENTATION=-
MTDVWTSYLMIGVDGSNEFYHVSVDMTLDYYNHLEELYPGETVVIKASISDLNPKTLSGFMEVYRKINGAIIARCSHSRCRIPRPPTA